MRLYELDDFDLTKKAKKNLFPNGLTFSWDPAKKQWLNPDGTQVSRDVHFDLMKSVGLDPQGNKLKPGMFDKIKGAWAKSGAGIDPKASMLGKVLGRVGGAIGNTIGRAVAPKDADGDGQADAASQDADGQADAASQDANGDGKLDAPSASKPVPNVVQPKLKALQSRTLQGDLNAAKELVNQLSDLKTKGFDVDNFIQAAAPAMKRGGLAKSDPQAYAHFTKLARSMRKESYEHLSRVLEAAGFTWEDVGYEVLVSESVSDYVMLVPVNEIAVYEMKKLAGI
jgi:hypothetical protein